MNRPKTPASARRTIGRALFTATLAAATTVAPLLASVPAASASPSASGVVDSGPSWTVTQVAGGYDVAVTLSSPLPVRDDIPEIEADGVDLGPATESADGLTLSATTVNTAVVTAKSVTADWSSGDPIDPSAPTPSSPSTLTPNIKAATPSLKPAVAPTTTPTGNPILSADPTTPGPYAYKVADYNFGAQAMPLADIGGIRGEVQGRIYLPTGGGPHPLVIFMHGRHSDCYNLTTLKSSSGWPCAAGSAVIESYAGYDGAGEALASNGYTVVSIGANAINANDNQLAPDDGAVARGQEILDTLTWLQEANEGQPVSFFDAATNQTLDLDQALVAGQTANGQTAGVTAADLVGTMDFNDIGVMGHSRGGEGAATAVSLNAGLAHPWAIKSVFELAPIDFTRDTVPDIPEATLLPYCDGDVSDQQGQHFYADSKGAFNDNVLRSDIWVMGTDHDFYNQDWTPPTPGASDDWTAGSQSALDPVCGEQATGTQRLTPADQFQVGSAYVAGWFELTLGGQNQFLPMFDGTGAEPPSITNFTNNGPGSITINTTPTPTTTSWAAGPSEADVRTVASEPASDRDDITSFASNSPLIGTSGTASASVCASGFGRTVPLTTPTCTTQIPAVTTTDPSSGKTVTAIPATSTSQEPYWTPASFAPNVPLNQMTHLAWTVTPAPTGSASAVPPKLSVNVPSGSQNVSGFSEMTVNLSPDQSVVGDDNLTVSVTDGQGNTWSEPLSAINSWTVTRMPGSPGVPAESATSPIVPTVPVSGDLGPNGKIVLQQAHIPTATLAAAGLDLADITNVSFTAPLTTAGGEYFQDLTFDNKAIGTSNPHNRPTVDVSSTKVEETSGPTTAKVAVYLDEPSTSTVTTYLSVLGSATGTVGLAEQPLTFQPGQTCQDVEIPVGGSTTPSATASSAFKFGVSDPNNAVLGAGDFGTITVVDPNLTPGTTPAPPVGVPGDPCTELTALSNPGTLTVSGDGNVAAGSTVTLTGHGYRNGESVAFTLGTTALGSAIADSSGNVSFAAQIPVSQVGGVSTFSAVGAGSGFTSTAKVDVIGGPPPALPETGQIIVLPLLVVLFGVVAFEIMRRRKRITKAA
jgi:trimeric autotransporter adhesin